MRSARRASLRASALRASRFSAPLTRSVLRRGRSSAALDKLERARASAILKRMAEARASARGSLRSGARVSASQPRSWRAERLSGRSASQREPLFVVERKAPPALSALEAAAVAGFREQLRELGYVSGFTADGAVRVVPIEDLDKKPTRNTFSYPYSGELFRMPVSILRDSRVRDILRSGTVIQSSQARDELVRLMSQSKRFLGQCSVDECQTEFIRANGEKPFGDADWRFYLADDRIYKLSPLAATILIID